MAEHKEHKEHKERKALKQTQALVASTLLKVGDILCLLNLGNAEKASDVAFELQDALGKKLDRTNEGLEQCLLWEQENE